jgi:hypothetical protein
MPRITREMLDFVGKARSVMEKNLSIVFYSEHIRYVPGSLVALRWGPEQTSILVVVAGDDAGTVFEGIVPPVVIAPRAPDQTVLLKKNPVQILEYIDSLIIGSLKQLDEIADGADPNVHSYEIKYGVVLLQTMREDFFGQKISIDHPFLQSGEGGKPNDPSGNVN